MSSVLKKKSDIKKENPNEVKGISQFLLGEKLGQGTFGKVRLATHIFTGEKVAIKILEKDKIYQQEDKDRVEKEIKILKMIRHNNLIQLYQIIQTPKLIYIVMEYSQGKDLFNYIVNNKKINENEACEYFHQIIEGADFLHKMKICHRDLKPENLLLENKTLKLIDFGLSNTWGKSGKLKTACGSPSYAAPEMILGESEYYGSRVDIWSCGVILYVMVCGFLPFEDTNTDKLYKKIIDGKYALPSFVTEGCKDLIRKIMTVDQELRYTIAEIKQHPWYKALKPKINEGLLSNKIVFPCDSEIIAEMREKGFNIDEVRESIILNKHNHLSTSYYLLVKKKIKNNIQSESDLFSEKYIKYISNPENQLSNYDNDIEKALEARLKEAKLLEDQIDTKNQDHDNNADIIQPFLNDQKVDIQENNESQSNLLNLDENIVSTSNPFEVCFDYKKLDTYNNNKLSNELLVNSAKVIVMSQKKEKNTKPSLVDIQRIKKKEQRLNTARPKNSSTSFDCTQIENLKLKANKIQEKYTEMKEKLFNKEKQKFAKTQRHSIDYNSTNKTSMTGFKLGSKKLTIEIKEDLKKQMSKCNEAKEKLVLTQEQNKKILSITSPRKITSPITLEKNLTVCKQILGKTARSSAQTSPQKSTINSSVSSPLKSTYQSNYLDTVNYPLDLTSNFFIDEKIIRKEIANVLQKQKYIIQSNSSLGVKAYKGRDRISISILKSDEIKYLNAVFFSKIDGEIRLFREVSSLIIQKLINIELNEKEKNDTANLKILSNANSEIYELEG